VRRAVDILSEAPNELLNCISPARYVGGEFNPKAKSNALLQTVFVFPDLYEIGMSNNALKIIYNRINELDDVSCDRAFAPAPDFEALLNKKNIPLYALETGLVLREADLLLWTLSYELCATTILAMLKTSQIPLHASQRGTDSPILIAGGPCVSNPLPFSPFFDAFWIGEAEGTTPGVKPANAACGNFFELLCELREAKKRGAERSALLEIINAHPAVWTTAKPQARRAINLNFGKTAEPAAIFPLPSMRIVQQHGTVEIMRGCPNGCRFCHAGIWYRPARQKKAEFIEAEVEALVREGFREISLASLSSGDYDDLEPLVERLNNRYSDERVSFQLPSLHISTLSLGILEKISRIRKSSLTFAVESPLDALQLALNKQVTLNTVCEMLTLSKKYGYKSAKFYFMIGLLGVLQDSQPNTEAQAIIKFIEAASKQTRMRFSISVGVFIPKPHTPFQWAEQLKPDEAKEALFNVLGTLKKQGHKVSVHDSLCSFLEGIISRGDERAALLVEEAFEEGCRLDAWSEHFKRDVWLRVIEKNAALVKEYSCAREPGKPLPWEGIKSGVSEHFLARELERARNGEPSAACAAPCTEKCGICKQFEQEKKCFV
jgi:radical SAM family uncharacterized protein